MSFNYVLMGYRSFDSVMLLHLSKVLILYVFSFYSIYFTTFNLAALENDRMRAFTDFLLKLN